MMHAWPDNMDISVYHGLHRQMGQPWAHRILSRPSPHPLSILSLLHRRHGSAIASCFIRPLSSSRAHLGSTSFSSSPIDCPPPWSHNLPRFTINPYILPNASRSSKTSFSPTLPTLPSTRLHTTLCPSPHPPGVAPDRHWHQLRAPPQRLTQVLIPEPPQRAILRAPNSVPPQPIHKYDLRNRRGSLSAKRIRRNHRDYRQAFAAVLIPEAYIHTTLNLDVNGKPLTYRSAKNGPDHHVWERAEADELIRLLDSEAIVCPHQILQYPRRSPWRYRLLQSRSE
jgi:hypothetical protein